MNQKKIVIVGGGFAGINLANRLADDNRFHITLVDRNNYNFFPPLLYQVATGFLEVSISVTLSGNCSGESATCRSVWPNFRGLTQAKIR